MKIYFKNPLTFTLIFFCAIGLFPVFHCILYKIDKKSYRVEEDFANYNLRGEQDILKKFKDSNLIRSLIGANANILDSLPLKLLRYKNLKFYTGEKIENQRKYGPIGVPRERTNKLTVLNISDSFDNIIISDSLFPDKSLRFYFLKYLNNLKESKKSIENSGHLADRDIWVESVSGFLFGDIKTVSTLAKLIRLLHLIFIYYLILMISKVIEGKKWLDLKT